MPETTTPLNILWITTDRQRWDTLGCYGNPFVPTPHLDALAVGGVRCEGAYAQSPICSPSRASFLTGRYPRTTRLNRNGQAIPADERLISRLLADAGYLCGHGGKLHLAPGDPRVTHWCERRIDDGYVVMDWSLHPPGPPVNAYTAWLAEQGVTFARAPVEDSPYISFGMPPETSNAGWTAQRAINFIQTGAGLDRPWFFTCGFEDPHEPFDPPWEFLQPLLDRLEEIPLPRYTPGELDAKPAFQRTDRAGVWGGGSGYFAAERMSDRDHRLIRAAYWAKIAHVDYQIGRVLDALRATGQLDNTLILFHADHGEMLGDHGIYFQGCYFYPEMIRVPLLLHCPVCIPGGQIGPQFVELTDLAPTVLEAAGLPVYAGMQGRSLWPRLTGASDGSHREDIYSEYYQAIPNGYRMHGGAYATHLRTAEYALTVAHNLGTGELYDLDDDPGEVVNRWDDPNYTRAKAELLTRLCDRMSATIDPLPPVEGAF
ncbi:MAG: Arylsulfatase [bacterium ADurb.Bin429]|nr:MAG: Arylsulfatase [bacterium ADurb.Bin429]